MPPFTQIRQMYNQNQNPFMDEYQQGMQGIFPSIDHLGRPGSRARPKNMGFFGLSDTTGMETQPNKNLFPINQYQNKDAGLFNPNFINPARFNPNLRRNMGLFGLYDGM